MDTKLLLYLVKEQSQISDFLSTFNNFNGLDTQGIDITLNDFLGYKGPNGVSNKDRILKSYDPQQLVDWVDGNGNPTVVKEGISVIFPASKILVEHQLIYNENQFVEQEDWPVYFDEYQRLLMNNDGYIKAEKFLSSEKGANTDVVIRNTNVKIWVYSKVLNQIIDVSSLVVSCSIAKNMSMGTFNFSLAPSVKLNPIVGMNTKGGGLNYVDIFNLLDNQGNLSSDFLGSHLQYNDLVFIRFERLEMEGDNTLVNQSFVVSESTLANEDVETSKSYRVWDMIGLIDSVNISTDFEMTDKTIAVIGRDLSKLLTDDGSYFYSYKYVAGGDCKSFYMGDPSWDVFRRNFVTGEYENYFFSYGLKRIRDYLGFVINHLSNLEIIPSSVFSSYGSRLSKVNKIKDIDDKTTSLEEENAKGIWGIVKLFVDENIDKRVFPGDLGNPDGTILQFFQRACQYPFVEFFCDTYIDMFNIIVRQPPFTESAVNDIVDNKYYIDIDTCDVLSMNIAYDTTSYSWYQISPANSPIGEFTKEATAFIPILFFPEFASTFGNKRLQVIDNYLFIKKPAGTQKETNLVDYRNSLLNDLLLLVESHVYLPFTKKGEITINGDRRIKVGTFIRLAMTDELYYVTQVTNNYTAAGSFDRTTTITVERGMRIDLIKGYESQDNSFTGDKESWSEGESASIKNEGEATVRPKTTYSYFNIINKERIKRNISSQWDGQQNQQTNNASSSGSPFFGVNKDVFEFFVKRKYIDINTDKNE